MSYYKNIIALRVRRGSRAPGRHRHPAAAAAIAFILRPHHGRGALRATSYTEDDFYCPVCQEVLKTPVRTAACQHVFCRKCFLTAMRESGIHCPLCRGNVTRRERACPERALDLENIMRKFSGSCRCCAKQIKFYRMRHHYKSCKKYQDEYGVSSLIPNFQISQDSVGNSKRSETSASDNIETYQENTGFCRKCFLTAMRESGIHCPLCRGNVTRRERACPERALDLENIMRKFSGSCRCCAKQIKFYRMRHHYKSCKKYQDEYGVSSLIPNFQISQDSVGNSKRSETSASDNIETYQENTGSSGHPTFKCPLCQESNFTRQRLLDHCNSNHLFQIVPVTCPICVSLPWGDPSQVTRNFVSHLNQRHQFDYGEFVNLQLDEETQYQTAVEESFQVNI
uniref:E3 ubiquitin-protein ligase RNF138 n=1 Tax=Bos mutus grunniens TaxID=30521 RepID=A0A8B9XYJ2_BOSMU